MRILRSWCSRGRIRTYDQVLQAQPQDRLRGTAVGMTLIYSPHYLQKNIIDMLLQL